MRLSRIQNLWHQIMPVFNKKTVCFQTAAVDNLQTIIPCTHKVRIPQTPYKVNKFMKSAYLFQLMSRIHVRNKTHPVHPIYLPIYFLRLSLLAPLRASSIFPLTRQKEKRIPLLQSGGNIRYALRSSLHSR